MNKKKLISIALVLVLILMASYSFKSEIGAPTETQEEGIPTKEFTALTDKEKKELLSAAIYSNDYETIKRFIGAGADPKNKDEEGWTMLMILASTNESDARIAKELIAGGAEVNAMNDDGTTALIEALMHARVNMELIESLVAAGADIEARDREGRTPLIIASQGGHYLAVKYFLELGGDKAVTDIHGKNAYYYAKEGGYGDIMDILE